MADGIMDRLSKIATKDTGKTLVAVIGGYVTADQGTSRLTKQLEQSMGIQVFDEVDGLLTAGAYFGTRGMVLGKELHDELGIGALVHSSEKLIDRIQANMG